MTSPNSIIASGTGSTAFGTGVTASGGFSVAAGLGQVASATTRTVSGNNSFGIFMGDPGSNYNLTDSNKFAIIGGEFQIDDAGGSPNKGCIRYDSDNTRLQYSHDCSSYADMGGGSSLWQESGDALRPVSASPKITWGQNSTASGYSSTAWGAYTLASGYSSTAFGIESRALGEGSVAWGLGDTDGDSFAATASGDGSTAWGAVTMASGLLSTVWGSHNYASGENSTAWGAATMASGYSSTAFGIASRALGEGSVAWGSRTHAGSYLETSLGRYPLNTAGNPTSWVATDTLFEIGIGTNDANRANAVTVLKNGNVGIGTTSPQSALHVPDGKYLQAEDHNAGPPPAADCDNDNERGRISLDTSNFRMYVCMGAARGWDHAQLID